MRRSANNFTPLSLGLTRFCLGRGSCDAHELAFVRARDDRASRLDAALPDIGMASRNVSFFPFTAQARLLPCQLVQKPWKIASDEIRLFLAIVALHTLP